jgi:exonuclease SbcC
MRPIRLELKGFTAFRDPQTIPFEGLDLFAISGQTGSGKSSILDAMTYALFGTVERVGKHVGQLVSQGQVRMAVCFEFAVDDGRFRVTRSTPAKGATKLLVERWDGEEWRQAGPGADRVTEANALIKEAVGLDYDAFTRTVLLPQGQFAEFLVGDAKDRRAILTDLLGLELFERLGKRAGEEKRAAESEANARLTLLETEYAGVTPDAVAAAEASAKAASQREEALAAAETSAREAAKRWADVDRAVRDLRACSADLREAAQSASRAAASLDELAARAAEISELVAEGAKALKAAEREVRSAQTARSRAEASWGRAVEVAALRARADSLVRLRDDRAAAEEELTAARKLAPSLERAAAAAARALAAATAEAEASLGTLAGAEASLEEARHADLVAAVRAGVHQGEDCPVCGAAITSLPRPGRAQPIEKARAVRDRAKERAESAAATLQAAGRAADRAGAEVRAAAEEIRRREQAVTKAVKDEEAVAQALTESLGGRLPADPVAALDERLARLEGLEEADGAAQEALAEAREALTAAERERDGHGAGVAEARARLESIALSGILDRARSLAGSDVVPPDVPRLPGARSADAAALGAVAGALAALVEGVGVALDEAAVERARGEEVALREAAGPMETLLDGASDVSSLAELVETVSAARTAAARAAATAEQEAARMRTRLGNAASIVEQIAQHRARADVFHALSQELQAHRLIAFLQVEALQLLAAAGSERLSTLSSGRYRLEFDADEFFVVDTWNGEERRSARTLSGGETFLASLALALALSEQVRSLAVTEKARLDSLFLDEGFGTLDPESLETVVEAIEQLGGDGRVVGVITHVQELAIRLPVRVEVEKSPRGSTLRVVS